MSHAPPAERGLDPRAHVFAPGELWYADASRPSRDENSGTVLPGSRAPRTTPQKLEDPSTRDAEGTRERPGEPEGRGPRPPGRGRGRSAPLSQRPPPTAQRLFLQALLDEGDRAVDVLSVGLLLMPLAVPVAGWTRRRLASLALEAWCEAGSEATPDLGVGAGEGRILRPYAPQTREGDSRIRCCGCGELRWGAYRRPCSEQGCSCWVCYPRLGRVGAPVCCPWADHLLEVGHGPTAPPELPPRGPPSTPAPCACHAARHRRGAQREAPVRRRSPPRPTPRAPSADAATRLPSTPAVEKAPKKPAGTSREDPPQHRGQAEHSTEDPALQALHEFVCEIERVESSPLSRAMADAFPVETRPLVRSACTSDVELARQ